MQTSNSFLNIALARVERALPAVPQIPGIARIVFALSKGPGSNIRQTVIGAGAAA